jgi:hypothetical protein
MNIVRCGLLLLLTAAIGCGDGKVKLPTAPVAGKVSYQGKPVAGGRITFLHQSGQGVAADLAADGVFKLSAYQGKNQVTVECFAPGPQGPGAQAALGRTQRKSLIPERYISYNTSDLSFEVKPNQENKADFTLKD